MESQVFVYVLVMALEQFEDNGIYKTYRLAQFCQGLLKTFKKRKGKERKEEEKRREKKEKNGLKGLTCNFRQAMKLRKP